MTKFDYPVPGDNANTLSVEGIGDAVVLLPCRCCTTVLQQQVEDDIAVDLHVSVHDVCQWDILRTCERRGGDRNCKRDKEECNVS